MSVQLSEVVECGPPPVSYPSVHRGRGVTFSFSLGWHSCKGRLLLEWGDPYSHVNVIVTSHFWEKVPLTCHILDFGTTCNSSDNKLSLDNRSGVIHI